LEFDLVVFLNLNLRDSRVEECFLSVFLNFSSFLACFSCWVILSYVEEVFSLCEILSLHFVG